MTVALELIGLLEQVAARTPLPRVRALHLPPAELAGTRQGEFCALQLEDGSLGLSYVLLDDTIARLAARRDDQGLAGADALELARRYATGRGAERTLGFAAINALTRCFFDRVGYVPDGSSDSIGQIAPRPGDRVGMIGMFTPLLGRVVESGAELTVVELKPELAGQHDGYRVTLDAAELGECNKVISTSTILLNDTLDRMLGCCARTEVFAMIGPGAGCLPDPLFARGVTTMGGSWVVNGDGFVDALMSGGGWGGHVRKVALDKVNYPGTPELLLRLRSA